MSDRDETDLLLFDDVRVIAERSRVLLCLIRDRTVWVHRSHVGLGSNVNRRGDHGRLVIPKWLAVDLDLL